jgi:hypothetical protein
MGAHRTEDRPTDVARLVGRGAVATSAALALAGTGAGLAFATPGHDDGSGSSGSGWGSSGSGHGNSGHASRTASSDRSCQSPDDDLVGGLLGDLGLGHSGRDGGSRSRHCDDGASGSADPASSASSSSSSSSSNSGTQQVSATQAAQSRITNPDDVPPAPGETKILDLPDHPSS